MAADAELPRATDREKRLENHSSSVPRKAGPLAVAVLAVMTIVIVYGYLDLPGSKLIGVANKRFWDYLELLFVPAALALGIWWLNWTQDERDRQAEDDRSQRESEAQAAQVERALQVENERAQDEALQAYLDKMSELLIDKELHKKSGDYDETRLTARARTLAVLERLDAKRKRTVLLFLREARLINRYNYCPKQEEDVLYYAHYVGLENADLGGADLESARLISTSEEEPISLKGANLEGAKLSKAILRGADLSGANLRGANLSGADLSKADVSEADLSETDLELAEMRKAGPAQADLRGADLRGAVLRGADLSGVDFRDAKGFTNEELEREAICIEGTIMPDGRE